MSSRTLESPTAPPWSPNGLETSVGEQPAPVSLLLFPTKPFNFSANYNLLMLSTCCIHDITPCHHRVPTTRLVTPRPSPTWS